MEKRISPADSYLRYLSSEENTTKNISVQHVPNKGRAVFADKAIAKGDFVVEYKGDLLTYNEAKKREKLYENDMSKGSYMFYFKVNDVTYCLDATEENNTLGRLINHSKKNYNLKSKTATVNGTPKLFFIASQDIAPGEELLVDYGERRRDVLKENPWLRT